MGDKRNTTDFKDKLVPPYEGRTAPGNRDEVSDQLRDVVKDVMQETHGPGRPGATTSPVEERPVRPGEVTDEVSRDPHGVGDSVARRGEAVKSALGEEPGRETLGTKGQSNRPYGTSDARDSTGVDPQRTRGGPNPRANRGGG